MKNNIRLMIVFTMLFCFSTLASDSLFEDETGGKPATGATDDYKDRVLLAEKTQEQTIANNKPYAIGSQGPGGGIVAYVDKEGFHGLEVQSQDVEKQLNWHGANAIGRTYGNGWYLPNAKELQYICEKRRVLGSFSNEKYWTSDGAELGAAVTIDFSTTLPVLPWMKDEVSKKQTVKQRPEGMLCMIGDTTSMASPRTSLNYVRLVRRF